MVGFGQIVIGPPGSGKSTYCNGAQQFFSAIGRKSTVVNLDPANDRLPYESVLDIRDFITLEQIMEQENLGPNGGLMYALESLDASIEEIVSKLSKLIETHTYLIFDCPGQIELFTHHSSLSKIFRRLTSQLDLRLCVVNLMDSFYITTPSQYVSIILLALRSMLQLDLPHVNVLSKIDLLSNYGGLPFNLQFYTEVQDLEYLRPYVEEESRSILSKKYARLTHLISEIVEDYNLVSFEVLSVDDKQSMINLVSVIDKSNGYMFGTTEVGGDTIWSEATRQGGYVDYDIQDRWVDNKKMYDEDAEKMKKQLLKQSEELSNLNETDEWDQAIKQWNQSSKQ